MSPAIRFAGRTVHRQRNLALLAENAFPRQQNADLNERIEEPENRLQQYENAHLIDKPDGAGQQLQNADSKQDDAGSDSSPERNSGHEGSTQSPPDPDRTVRVGKAYCPNCDRVLTVSVKYISRGIVAAVRRPFPSTNVRSTALRGGEQTQAYYRAPSH